jgi:hypothetical protein
MKHYYVYYGVVVILLLLLYMILYGIGFLFNVIKLLIRIKKEKNVHQKGLL